MEYHYTVPSKDFSRAGDVSAEMKKTLQRLGIPADVIKRTAIKTGKMRTLLMDGIMKARSGVTTLSEIIRVTATMV